MSTSVLRRYTPPTCTLEIAATGSALSRWTDRTVLKNLRFQLSFDDPKLPPDQQVTIKGDRSQLEALCEAVEAYVQKILNQPPEQVSSLHSFNEASNEASVDTAKLPKVIPFPSPAHEMNNDVSDQAGIHLKPQGFLAHELCLGTLTDDQNNSVIRLNVLQLFDLANALDAYHAEALTLPALGRPSWMKSPAGWARIAAVALLTVGATGAIAKFVMDVSSPSQVASSEQEVEVSSAQRPESLSSSSPLPVPPGIANAPATLKADQPLLPPKPPAGALQPVPVPSPVLEAPPPGSVSVSQLPASQPANNSAGAAAPDSLPALPIPADPQIASSSTGSVTTIDPLADAPAPAAITSTAPDPAAVSLAPSGISITGQNRTATTTSEAAPQPAPPLNPVGRNSASPSTQVATRNTAFDSYPQIAEVRNYFAQNWQPPEELTQTLEYRLVLNPQGAIQLIVPLGEASGRYLDRTNMPLMDEPFVSPLQDIDQLQVRLVLDPNGQVRTFAEGN